MRYHSYTTEDRDYLEELLGYFPVSPPLSLDKAQEIIRDRGQSLDAIDLIQAYPAVFSGDNFFQFVCVMPCFLHRLLFTDVLSNAGEYRKGSDPNGGVVEFGLPVKKLTDAGGSSSGRFSGIDPAGIDKKVKEICGLLEGDCNNPLRNAAIFYQKFIRIHPFYDGNGRIGRFIVDSFLYYHNLYIDWEKLKKTTRWIRQLNYCHRKTNDNDSNPAYGFALKWWTYYLEKFKHDIPQE